MLGELLAQAKSLPADEAERLLEQALRKERYRAPLPDVANLLVWLASYACDAEHYATALARLDEAVRMFERHCGPNDARTAHARSEIARVLERSGDLPAALVALYDLEPNDARPPWRWLHIAELEAKCDHPQAADEALEAARAGAASAECDAMTDVGSIVRIAEALSKRGRSRDAEALLTGALRGIDDVIAGRRMSPSARAPGDVRASVVAAIERLGGVG
jgi:tetratricopeptide (TPR) repeat protein